jgi:tetratricopeptide (TPR) repeat protein
MKTSKKYNLSTITLLIAAFLLGGCGIFDIIEARKLARAGNDLYLESDYLGAITKYKKALALDDNTPNIHLNLGYAYFSIYDPDSKQEIKRQAAKEAVAAFSTHLLQHPEDENARVFQIKTLLKAAPKDAQLATQAYNLFIDLLEKNPTDDEARQYLITLFIDSKRYEDAVKFFSPELAKNPDDIETMKILAIIADKSDRIQEAIEWYWRRAANTKDIENKASLFYEVGTFTWNLLHYQPDRIEGVEIFKLIDQGIEACRRAMELKEDYAEAMTYANLLYLKRALYEPEEIARTWDQTIAFDLRSQAGKILVERKKMQNEPEKLKAQKDKPKEKTTTLKK